jgi:dTDP-4-amino-4,6-dideoxygalactose transaminase
VEALRSKLEQAERTGKLPKIVIPVHFSGQSCDMRAIRELADRYGFYLIEDASHAIGGRYDGGPVGDCRYSDITVFSFHPVKIVTTGEGGIALTNKKELAERMRQLRSHGITRDPALMTGESQGPWYYQQIALGMNYRITDIQAALGFSQMQRLDTYVRRRHHLAARYDEMLEDLPVVCPHREANAYSAFHLYVVKTRDLRPGVSRRKVFERMRASGIGVNVHYIPVHIQPYYRRLGFQIGDFPDAESYYEDTLSLPLYPTMTDVEQETVVTALRGALA